MELGNGTLLLKGQLLRILSLLVILMIVTVHDHYKRTATGDVGTKIENYDNVNLLVTTLKSDVDFCSPNDDLMLPCTGTSRSNLTKSADISLAAQPSIC